MPKNIYLSSDEEIISVIDKLVQNTEPEINLIVPPDAQIWQSVINLRLLKREADNLGKQVTFVVSDDLNASMAERTGFLFRKERSLPLESASEEEVEAEPEAGIEPEPAYEPEESEAEARTVAEDDQPDDGQFGDADDDSESDPEDEEEEPEMPERDQDKLIQKNQDVLDYLIKELKPQDRPKPSEYASFSNLSGKKSKNDLASTIRTAAVSRRMSDIVDSEKKPKINVFETKKKSRDKKAFRFSLSPRLHKEPFLKKAGRKEFESAGPKIEGIKRMSGKSVSPVWSKILIGLAAVSILAGLVIANMVLPNAKIVISPKVEKVSLNLKVVGSKKFSQPDEALNRIPLEEVEMSKTKSEEFYATGEKEINDKAEGVITIYNEYSSSPQTLVATTRFESPDGKVFRILENITVPGAQIEENKIVASSIKVEVVADQPGADYNIGPTNFTVPGFKGTPKFSGFYAKSDTSMTGGMVSRAKVVSEDDIQKAQQKVSEALKDEISDSFRSEIPDGWKLIDKSMKEEIKVISSAQKDDQTEKFKVEVESRITALLFREEELKQLVEVNIAAQVSADKTLVSQSQQIKWVDSAIDEADEEVTFSLYAEEDVFSHIDEEQLRDDLAGKPETEVRKYLAQRPELKEAEVNLWPFWVKKIPSRKNRIKIVINLPSASS